MQLRYTARAVTASSAPWPLKVGTRTFWARPLSAAFALRVLPALASPVTQAQAANEAMRAAFPKPRGWFVRWRDPLRHIAQLSPDIKAHIIQAMFAVPGQVIDAERDPIEALKQAHRQMANPHGTGKSGPTLALMALTCEMRLGATWYFNPERWPTSDGYAPFATVILAHGGLQALNAQETLRHVHAQRLVYAKEGDLRSEQARAYPPDLTVRGAG